MSRVCTNNKINNLSELKKYINDRIDLLERKLKSKERPSVVEHGINHQKVAEINAQLFELETLRDKLNF